MRKGQDGFTLIEIIAGLAISSLVFMGVMEVTTTALKAHYEQIRRGQDTTSEIYGLDQMLQDFQATTHLEYGFPDNFSQKGYGGDYWEVRGCFDYSQALGGPIDGNWANVNWYHYGITWPPGVPRGGNGLALVRDSGPGCPVGTGFNSGNPDAIIVTNFYPIGYPSATQTPVWSRNWAGGLDMQFTVGIATANFQGPGTPAGYGDVAMPIFYKMTTATAMSKSYNPPLCGGKPCD